MSSHFAASTREYSAGEGREYRFLDSSSMHFYYECLLFHLSEDGRSPSPQPNKKERQHQRLECDHCKDQSGWKFVAWSSEHMMDFLSLSTGKGDHQRDKHPLANSDSDLCDLFDNTEAKVCLQGFITNFHVKLFDGLLPVVLLGGLCDELGYSYLWKPHFFIIFPEKH